MVFFIFGFSSAMGQTHSDTLVVQPHDPWLGFDKVQHFTFSFLWTLSTQYAGETKMEVQKENMVVISVSSSLAVGLAKEVYDSRKPKGFFSKKDMIADGLGILCAVIIILI